MGTLCAYACYTSITMASTGQDISHILQAEHPGASYSTVRPVLLISSTLSPLGLAKPSSDTSSLMVHMSTHKPQLVHKS